jgi:hypothetical protein
MKKPNPVRSDAFIPIPIESLNAVTGGKEEPNADPGNGAYAAALKAMTPELAHAIAAFNASPNR